MRALGLPASAWQNGMSYAASAFPTDGRVGDRVFKDNRWWTYVLVSGTYYWVPDPGTLVAKISQRTAQTIDQSATLNYTHIEHELFECWQVGTPSTVQPSLPGWYGFRGSASFTSNATGWRHARWRKNGGDFDGCGALLPAASGISTTCVLPSVSVYLNGTTDFVNVFVQHNAGAGVGITSDTTTPYRYPVINLTYEGL